MIPVDLLPQVAVASPVHSELVEFRPAHDGEGFDNRATLLPECTFEVIHFRGAVFLVNEHVISRKVSDVRTINHAEDFVHGGDVSGEVFFLDTHSLDRGILGCELSSSDLLIADRECDFPRVHSLAVVRERDPKLLRQWPAAIHAVVAVLLVECSRKGLAHVIRQVLGIIEQPVSLPVLLTGLNEDGRLDPQLVDGAVITI